MHREGTLRRLFAQISTRTFPLLFGDDFTTPVAGKRSARIEYEVTEGEEPKTSPPSYRVTLTATIFPQTETETTNTKTPNPNE